METMEQREKTGNYEKPTTSPTQTKLKHRHNMTGTSL